MVVGRLAFYGHSTDIPRTFLAYHESIAEALCSIS
jgi:hypothetical protein